MRTPARSLVKRGLDHSVLRFLLVGGCGELLYLGLYAAALRVGANSVAAIALAGGICLVVNALLHARISFRVRFRWPLLLDYLLIQSFCLVLAVGLGWVLQQRGVGAAGVGMATLVLWSGTSFLLTRWRYQRPAASVGTGGLGSRQTSQRP